MDDLKLKHSVLAEETTVKIEALSKQVRMLQDDIRVYRKEIDFQNEQRSYLVSSEENLLKEMTLLQKRLSDYKQRYRNNELENQKLNLRISVLLSKKSAKSKLIFYLKEKIFDLERRVRELSEVCRL